MIPQSTTCQRIDHSSDLAMPVEKDFKNPYMDYSCTPFGYFRIFSQMDSFSNIVRKILPEAELSVSTTFCSPSFN